MAYDPKLGYSDPTQVQQNQIGFAPEIAPYAQQVLGQAQAYQLILQEISNLLDNKEQKNEDGNVINIGNTKGSPKN